MADNPVDPAILGLTAQIVSAHASNNELESGALPVVIRAVYDTLLRIGDASDAPVERPTPAVPIRKSVFPDYIVCLEDGKRLKMLKRHLATSYNLTPDQYPGEMGPGRQLSDGRPELCRTAFGTGQADRPGHPPHGRPLTGPGAATKTVAPCHGLGVVPAARLAGSYRGDRDGANPRGARRLQATAASQRMAPSVVCGAAGPAVAMAERPHTEQFRVGRRPQNSPPRRKEHQKDGR